MKTCCKADPKCPVCGGRIATHSHSDYGKTMLDTPRCRNSVPYFIGGVSIYAESAHAKANRSPYPSIAEIHTVYGYDWLKKEVDKRLGRWYV